MTLNSTRPRIGLAMIVRNEAHIIERCLGSVRGLIDTWTIVDTGSTDNTVELVKESLAGIPGNVHTRPWRDFSTNRNELLEMARPTAGYLLLLDADMIVRITSAEPLADLTEVAYDIMVESGLQYRMPYLVSSELECSYIGRTHEYLSFAPTGATATPCDDIVITHIGDGGNRDTKLQRDLGLLESDAYADPDNARTFFYLAQTREGLGDVPGALAAYRRRIELDGWEEEIFWSMYKCGMLLEAAGDWPAAAQMYITAWEFRSHRVEPLVHLARGYRESGAHGAALMWAERAALIKQPAGDRLFVEPWMYSWGVQLELAANSWWCGDRERAQFIWRELLERTDIPADVQATVSANLAQYS
jgi:glycosyltransferase involved in cell wall biosynthesis